MKKKKIYIYIYIYLGGFSSSWKKNYAKKKKKKKKQKLEWATTHFQFVLGHDTAYCIVTQQGWEASRRGAPRHSATGHDTAQQATTRPLLGHNTARQPMIQSGACATRHAVRLAGSWVAIQKLYRG